MSEIPEERKLLELGRELSERLLRQSDPRDSEALFQARRRALQAITPPARATAKRGGWLPAAVITSITAFAIAMILHWWDDSPLQNDTGEHSDFLAKNFTADEAPWNENLDMLQNMDFSLWLDMADPQDAG